MTLFSVIYCRRSDGKLEIVTKSKGREKNEPTKEQLDAKPDAKGVSDYYRLLGLQDSKHLDWRRKLAGMLARELGSSDYSPEKAYILDDLPENYRLYEHVKTKADADAKGGKTHAGGGHDRQDAYLYGHPLGRKKRYRSPADFFPHLLWLCTDGSGDMMNCACKVCSPDEIQVDTKPAAPTRGGTVAMKVDSQSVVGKNPVVEIPARPAPQQQPPASASASASASIPASSSAFPRPPAISAAAASPRPTQPQPQPRPPQPPQPQSASTPQPQRQPVPASIPAPKSIDQQIDTSYAQLSFRLGELVWFKSGTIWALGVILRRWAMRNLPLSNGRRYMVQPLAAPYSPQTPIVIDSETNMRPWLAWSPPAFCHPGLNQLPSPSYTTMDWNALVRGDYGNSNNDLVKVDASILAARAIDSTYTPFGFINASPVANVKADANPHHSTHQIQWNGVYLGGERIWLGDPVLLRLSNNENVLVVSQIIERPVEFIDPQQQGLAPTKVLLTGNVFSCSTVTTGAVPAEHQHLIPARMREDLEARNRAFQAIPGPKSYWKLIQPGQAVDLIDVRGRWYETSIMAPIVNGQASYDDCVRNGQTDSVARSFNSRVDMQRTAGKRCDTREAAIGRAAPEHTRLIEGIEPPQPVEQPQPTPPQPQPQAQPMSDFEAQMADVGGHQEHGDGLVDQFMDLGGMEGDGMPAFGQEYGSQGTYFP